MCQRSAAACYPLRALFVCLFLFTYLPADNRRHHLLRVPPPPPPRQLQHIAHSLQYHDMALQYTKKVAATDQSDSKSNTQSNNTDCQSDSGIWFRTGSMFLRLPAAKAERMIAQGKQEHIVSASSKVVALVTHHNPTTPVFCLCLYLLSVIAIHIVL
jgi:hypothetical protein